MPTPYQTVLEKYQLPFELYEFQVEAVNKLAPLPRTGCYADPGTGKTAMSTVMCLYKHIQAPGQTVVIVPPILITSWVRWLRKFSDQNVLDYRGSPKKRLRHNLQAADWIVLSIQTFKNDHARFMKEFEGKVMRVLVDEATSIKNVGTGNHKKVNKFAEGRDLLLLTGTPISQPGDAYAYIKMVAPGTYRNQHHFHQMHVAERDFFDNITKWRNLDLMQQNMLINSVRIIKEEVLHNLPPLTYDPIFYQLAEDHQALYDRLANQQFLILKEGGKIDATNVSKLYNMLQQIVMNSEYFSEGSLDRAVGYDLLDQILEELDTANVKSGRKLLVYSNFRMTTRNLLEYLKPYKAVGAYSEISSAKQSRNADAFMFDPECRVLVAHPLSGGVGLNFQDVCSDVLFLEEPIIPSQFHQSIARTYREGQRRGVVVRIAVAENTLQVRLHNRLMQKDSLANSVQGGWQDLQDAIHGRN